MGEKKLILSVTLKDCRVDTFRAGGPGGQKQNKTNSGVRITHLASGAVGESREQRSQLQNKRAAFKRMAETSTFKTWLRRQLGQDTLDEIWVDRQMWPVHLRTEVFRDGHWTENNGMLDG